MDDDEKPEPVDYASQRERGRPSFNARVCLDFGILATIGASPLFVLFVMLMLGIKSEKSAGEIFPDGVIFVAVAFMNIATGIALFFGFAALANRKKEDRPYALTGIVMSITSWVVMAVVTSTLR